MIKLFTVCLAFVCFGSIAAEPVLVSNKLYPAVEYKPAIFVSAKTEAVVKPAGKASEPKN
jgi:hypothetical protein